MESKVSVNIDNRIFLTEKSVTQIVISEGMAKIYTSKVLGNGVCEDLNYVAPLCNVKISINAESPSDVVCSSREDAKVYSFTF